MIRMLNAFMLHGKSLDTICSIAKQADCAGIALEVSQLEEAAGGLLKAWGLSASFAGTLFLAVEMSKQSCQRAQAVLERARAAGIPQVAVVLQSALPAGEERRHAQEELAGRLAQLGEQYGVCVCVEPLHPSCGRLSSLTDLRELERLCRHADPRWFGWILDLCHWEQPCPLLIPALMPYLRSVHLADVRGSDPNDRCFPGEGRLPLLHWFSLLRRSGYQGPVELEVLSPELERLEEAELIRKIRRAFVPAGCCFLAGELALHRHLSPGGKCLLEAVGGSAGMAAFQLQALGVQPVLVGICGDDPAGQRMAEDAGLIGWKVICQRGRVSSLVEIDAGGPDRIAVTPGNVDVRQLSPAFAQLPDGPAYVYLPCFPGYEGLAEIAEHKAGWNILYDFGFHPWCGDGQRLHHAITKRRGFCALLNGKGLTGEEKRRLGECSLLQGFSYAVVTDGAASVLLFKPGGCTAFAVEEAPAVDTCGAGDCLAAGILAGLAGGRSMEQALRLGMETARRKVQVHGIAEKEVRCG